MSTDETEPPIEPTSQTGPEIQSAEQDIEESGDGEIVEEHNERLPEIKIAVEEADSEDEEKSITPHAAPERELADNDTNSGLPDEEREADDEQHGASQQSQEASEQGLPQSTGEDAPSQASSSSPTVNQTPDAEADSIVQTPRQRSDSRSTTISRSGPVSSTVFVVNALESIAATKEVRRNKEFNDAVQAALANIKSQEHAINPEIIFKPLQLATKSFTLQLQVTALDCIGKLISYSYFAFPAVTITSPDAQPQSPQPTPLIERAIETICDCFEPCWTTRLWFTARDSSKLFVKSTTSSFTQCPARISKWRRAPLLR